MSDTADIKIADIEEELSQLQEVNKDQNLIRACLFNLIVYTIDAKHAQYFEDLIHTIIEKFPCRILFIKEDKESGKDFLYVETSNVTTEQGNNIIACDQITIKASPSQLHRVPFLILPHLIPDLPIYLLWGQNPVDEHKILPQIQKYATRIIFDSESLDNLQLFSQRLLNKMDAFRSLEIMDINWALTSNWREVLAQIFNTPEKICQLSSSKTIDITYNDYKTELLKNSEIRAVYLQAWLASQLNWKFVKIETVEGKRILTYMNQDHQHIIITLCTKMQQDLPPGAILEVKISTKDEHFCSILRKQKLSQVIVHASTLEKCELPFTLPLPNIHRGFGFMKEIFYYSLSDHYRHMLEKIAQIECSPKK